VGGFFALLSRPFFTGPNFNVSHIPVNRTIEGTGSTVLPLEIVSELTRRSAHRVIIRRCTCRDSENCREFPIEEACLLLGEDTRHIDSRVAEHVSVEDALKHAEKMIEMGLIPMIGRVRMDDFFWGVPNCGKMLTICFCCRCCCTILKSARYFPPYAADALVKLKGLTVSVDSGKCVKCGACAADCFMKAITMGEHSAIHDQALCKGCGRCATVCPNGAVSIRLEDADDAVRELSGRIRERVNIE
jgi:UDP-glucose 4-epimerase